MSADPIHNCIQLASSVSIEEPATSLGFRRGIANQEEEYGNSPNESESMIHRKREILFLISRDGKREEQREVSLIHSPDEVAERLNKTWSSPKYRQSKNKARYSFPFWNAFPFFSFSVPHFVLSCAFLFFSAEL